MFPLLLTGLILAFRGAPQLHGQSEAAAISQARQFLSKGDLASAEKLLEAQLKISPTSSESHFLLGFIYFRQQDAKNSLAQYTLGAVGRRPSASEFKVIGADYVLLHDYADADRWFTEATKDDAQDASAWYLLGRAKYNEGKGAEAVASFKQSLSIEPDSVKAEDNLGLSYQSLNQLAEARAAFEKAIEMQERDRGRSGAPYLDLGELMLQQGEAKQAIETLRLSVMRSPSNPKAHEQLGVAMERTNDLQNARIELEKASALAPNASPIHFELGQIYRKLGLDQDAKRELERCARLTATHSSEEVPNVEGIDTTVDSKESADPPN